MGSARILKRMDRPFDRVAAGLYLQEAFELVDALLYRLDRLDEAADLWLKANALADEQVRAIRSEFDREGLNRALQESRRQQAHIFDEVEAFLAAWSRLSLLFWPAPLRDAPNRGFTIERGRLLQRFLRLDADSPLNDRGLRNAWMHTDERFDQAWLERRLGNRQQFVRTVGVADAVRHSVRVLDVESLNIHFRDNDGALIDQPLRPLRGVLQDLLERRQEAFRERLAELPDHVD